MAVAIMRVATRTALAVCIITLVESAKLATTGTLFTLPKSAYCCGFVVRLKPRLVRAAMSMLALEWKGNPGGCEFNLRKQLQIHRLI
jgi:hypothetical protein